MKTQIKSLFFFLLQCFAIATLNAQTSLVAYYPFNGNAIDQTGNGYNGTVHGATLCDDRFGNPSSAYSFDGSNDDIVIGKEPNFPSWDTYAVSVWFLNDGGGDQGQGYGQKILSKAQFYTDFHLGVLNDGSQGRLSWWSAQGGFNAVDATNQDYRDSQWHHAVLNKNSPTEGDLWVDGVLQNSSSDLQAVVNNENLVIGFTTHDDGYQQKHWSGKIDDFRIYDGVLTSGEIADLFKEGGYNPGCFVPSNLSPIDITPSSARIKWSIVAGALKYKVRYKVAGTNAWTKITNISSASKIISGLAAGTPYKYEVKSVCSADPIVSSDWSSPQLFTTLEQGGEDQYFTVPEGVTQLTVKLWGAGGAGGDYVCDDLGGGGGFVTGTIHVTPGETLTIVVGGKGETGAGPGAYGGGGGKANGVGGRGGGRSAIVRNGFDIVTAGGGGGGGGGTCVSDASGGGGGGLEGTASYWSPYSGEPGSATAPGAGGHRKPDDFIPNCTCGSNPGDGHTGGYASAYDNGYHGSGGGGYFGGGSGTDFGDGGGGGGSGFVPDGGYSEQGNTMGLRIPGGTTDPDYPGNNIGYGGAKGKDGNNGAVIIVGYWPLLKVSESNVYGTLQIYPNPAQDQATIHFMLLQSSHITIKVFDVSGREIASVLNDDLQKGDHSIQHNTAQFPKGIYMVRMVGDSGITNLILIVE